MADKPPCAPCIKTTRQVRSTYDPKRAGWNEMPEINRRLDEIYKQLDARKNAADPDASLEMSSGYLAHGQPDTLDPVLGFDAVPRVRYMSRKLKLQPARPISGLTTPMPTGLANDPLQAPLQTTSQRRAKPSAPCPGASATSLMTGTGQQSSKWVTSSPKTFQVPLFGSIKSWRGPEPLSPIQQVPQSPPPPPRPNTAHVKRAIAMEFSPPKYIQPPKRLGAPPPPKTIPAPQYLEFSPPRRPQPIPAPTFMEISPPKRERRVCSPVKKKAVHPPTYMEFSPPRAPKPKPPPASMPQAPERRHPGYMEFSPPPRRPVTYMEFSPPRFRGALIPPDQEGRLEPEEARFVPGVSQGVPEQQGGYSDVPPEVSQIPHSPETPVGTECRRVAQTPSPQLPTTQPPPREPSPKSPMGIGCQRVTRTPPPQSPPRESPQKYPVWMASHKVTRTPPPVAKTSVRPQHLPSFDPLAQEEPLDPKRFCKRRIIKEEVKQDVESPRPEDIIPVQRHLDKSVLNRKTTTKLFFIPM